MPTFPTSGPLHLARLAGAVGFATLTRRDRAEALHEWFEAEATRLRSRDFFIGLGSKRILLVGSAELSAHILAPSPSTDGFAAGAFKTKGMSYLAPSALTISNDEPWQRRRRFNEEVLAVGASRPINSSWLEAVDQAFATPVGSVTDIRRRMGRVMNEVVFGGNAPAELAADVDRLKGVVDSPLRRALVGRRNRDRVDDLYATLRRLWEQAPNESLLGHAKRHGPASDETLEQVPHWIFTFTGSGTDLLAKTLAMVGSRPDAAARIRSEASPDDHDGFGAACLLETGRLFAPVARTFHRAPSGASYGGRTIPPGTEIVHYLPLQQRRRSDDPTTDDFVPERWLDQSGAASYRRYPNLFLSGARVCPGRDLVLPILEQAMTAQLVLGASVGAPRLASDPLPLSFPWQELRFRS